MPSQPYDLAIAKGSKRMKLAKTYVNYTLRQDVQKAICSAIPLTPANKNVELDEEFAKLIIQDPSRLFEYDYAYVASRQAEWRTAGRGRSRADRKPDGSPRWLTGGPA